MIDFSGLAARLLQAHRSLLPKWFPAGKLHGHEFRVGDLAGSEGESLSINVVTGRWQDFSTGDKGGDLISLYAAMHGIKQAEAVKQLDDGTIAARVPPAAQPKPERSEWEPVIPIPADAPPPPDEFYRKEQRDWVKLVVKTRWTYVDATGAALGHTCRFEWFNAQGELCKDIVPQVYCRNADGKHQWRWRAFATPRPLYNLKELHDRPTAHVCIVEGEKKVEALRKLAPQYVGIAWPGGAKAWRKADWSPIHGRKVLLWPDADQKTVKTENESARYRTPIGELIPRDMQPGILAMWEIGHHVLPKCPEVKIILPAGKPDGWDAADALAEGWDWAAFKSWAVPLVQTITGGTNGKNAGASLQSPTASQARAVAGTVAVERSQAGLAGVTATADRSTRGHAEHQIALGTLRGRNAGALQTTPDTSQPLPRSHVGRWLAFSLDCNGNGAPYANLNNAMRVLESDPKLRGLVWYDEFLQRILTDDPAREWSDADDINLTLYMQRDVGLTKIGLDIVRNAVILLARRDTRNCVRDWMDGLVWDGTPRIDHFFQDVFGAEDNEYTRAAGRNFWISIVARVFTPGCKVDNMIILEGAQGLGKSQALAVIGGDWFTEQHENATNSKAFAEILQGKLIVEISEMDAFSKAEVNTIKKIVSCQSDRYRPAYGRHAIDHRRQGVMIGTTNKDDWNRDETGARRSWPIRCEGQVRLDVLRDNRAALFAEAIAAFKAGGKWWEMPDERTRQEQQARYDADPWIDAIAKHIAGRAEVNILEILQSCIKKSLHEITRTDQMRVATCLRALGWRNSGNAKRAGKVRRVWVPDANNTIDATETPRSLPEVATGDSTSFSMTYSDR